MHGGALWSEDRKTSSPEGTIIYFTIPNIAIAPFAVDNSPLPITLQTAPLLFNR
jgi:hypothetical protein